MGSGEERERVGDSGEERERVGDSGEERERVGDSGDYIYTPSRVLVNLLLVLYCSDPVSRYIPIRVMGA